MKWLGQFKIWPLKLCNRPAALFTLFKPADQHANFSSFQLFTQLDILRIYLENTYIAPAKIIELG